MIRGTEFCMVDIHGIADGLSFGLVTKIRKRLAYDQSGVQLNDEVATKPMIGNQKNPKNPKNSNVDNCRSGSKSRSRSPALANTELQITTIPDSQAEGSPAHSPRRSLSTTNRSSSVSGLKMTSKPSESEKGTDITTHSSKFNMKRSNSQKVIGLVSNFARKNRDLKTLQNIRKDTSNPAAQGPQSIAVKQRQQRMSKIGYTLTDPTTERDRYARHSPSNSNQLALLHHEGSNNDLTRQISRLSQVSNMSTATESTSATGMNYKLVYDTHLMPGFIASNK